MLEVRNVAGGYGGPEVVHDVSLRAGNGITGLIGSNGAGKTTLLRCVVGLLAPSGGSVLFNGKDVTRQTPEGRVAEGLVCVPEGRHLFSSMTVAENLHVGAYGARGRAAQVSSREFVYGLFPVLADRTAQLAGTLSGGEQQMLALARGLMSKPLMLICDEPSLGLAPRIISEVSESLQQIASEGIDILLCEQNSAMTFAVADSIYVMERGAIALHGSSAELQDDPQVRSAYLGVGRV